MADIHAAAPVPVPGAEGDRPDHRKKTISNAYLHRLQRRHFLLFDIVPIIGTAGAFAFLAVHPFGVTELALLLSLWLLTGLGVTVGYHRLFTHRTFKAAPPVEAALAVLGSMAGQGGVVSWAALHRRHHECSDREGDPHSPNLSGGGLRGRVRGLVHSHFLWMHRHDYPNVVHYTPDLVKNRRLVRISRAYYYIVVAGVLLPALIAGLVEMSWTGALSGLLWGGLVRIFLLEHIVWAINSFLHSWGTRPYDSREESRNGCIFALLTLGEAWHNNHHAFPESASFGLDWYRADPGFWLIRLLAAGGLVWDIGLPTPERRSAKRTRRAASAASSPA
jgi:stearoyl-CoA desaturase (Delta-9 desaturase)